MLHNLYLTHKRAGGTGMLNIHVADENHNKQTGGGGKTNGLPDLAPKRMFITINVHWQINHSYSR